MDTVLLAVTILSLAMALALAFIVAKLMREDRARSEARVNALGMWAAQPDAEAPLAAPLPAAPSARVAAPTPPHPVLTSEGRTRTAGLDDLDLRPPDETIAGVRLFEDKTEPSPWRRRFVVIAALAAIVIAVVFAFRPGGSGAAAPAAAAASAAQPPAVLDSAPLELVALHHTQQSERLVITGLVQNPRRGSAISHVVATAFLFGPDGAFLTSNRAPLDFTTLSPGDESAFVINVPVTGPVARYRIGFRTEDGRVIEHVDKRAPDALAQK